MPYLCDETAHSALAYAWQAAAAMYATFGARTDLSRIYIDEAKAGNADELIDRAIACGDEHAIKFTEVCLREHAFKADHAFFAAAAHAIQMLSDAT